MTANEIINYSTNYSHCIEANKTTTLIEYANIIERIYDNERSNLVVKFLRRFEGTIVKNRHGKIWLRYRKQK